jgi:hypothetical protein
MANTSFDYNDNAQSLQEDIDVWETTAFAVVPGGASGVVAPPSGRAVTEEIAPEAPEATATAPAPAGPDAWIGRISPKSTFAILSAQSATGLERHRSPRYKFQSPMHWKSPIAVNPYAEKVERLTLRWLADLGCSHDLIDRVRQFRPGHHAGIPFPLTASEKTLRLAKYLGLWLLWNDLGNDGHELRLRLTSEHVLTDQRPAGLMPLELGWLELLQEFAILRSPDWVEDLCQAMADLSEATAKEAADNQRHRDAGVLPSFSEGLKHSTETSGMDAAVYLLEDSYDFELPRAFHDHPATRRLKLLASQIVGLGNDIISFGKDHAQRRTNLVTILMHENSIPVETAMADLIQMHNDTVNEYDCVAAELPRWTPATDYYVRRWLKDLRYACLGFSLWAAGAPRYTAYKVLSNGKIIEPTFSYLAAPGA